MNGKIARELRKVSTFTPSTAREYQDIVFSSMKKVYQYNPETNKTNVVDRVVDSFTKECVDASRKTYQYLKRKYVNPSHEANFNVIPNKDDIKKIQDGFVKEQAEMQERIKVNESEQPLGVALQQSDEIAICDNSNDKGSEV